MRWIHNFFLTWDLVNEGKAEAVPPFSNITKPKVPINRVLNSSVLFYRWMTGLKFSRPIQILVERVKLKEADDLPAIKTAAKCLSSLNKDYSIFYSQVIKERKRIEQEARAKSLKLKNQKKK